MFLQQVFCFLCIFLYSSKATLNHPPIVTGSATLHGQCVLLEQEYPGLIGQIFDESSKGACDLIQHFPPEMVTGFITCCNTDGTFFGCCPDACPDNLMECLPAEEEEKPDLTSTQFSKNT